MRNMPILIIAGGALLCSASLTSAQETKTPGAPGGAPPAGAHPGGPASGGKGSTAAPTKHAPSPNRGPSTEKSQPRANAPANKASSRSAEGKDRPVANQGRDKAAEQGEKRHRAAERNAAEPNQHKSQRGAGTKEQKPEASKNAEANHNEKQAQRHEKVRATRSKLSDDQRQHLRTGFDLRRARVTNAKFAMHVGTRIPRQVRLFAIPAAILAIVPAYSYYRYVVVDDRVCIIDPGTYEIVDVIDEGPYPATSRPQVAGLQLASPERAMLLNSIPSDFPPADVRIRLALGAEVPRSVELHMFPDVVLDRISKLRDFRFVVVERDVVVVDPRDRGVAMVIER